jgi:hypothetical protein
LKEEEKCVPNQDTPAFQPIKLIEQRDGENLARIATQQSRRQSILGYRLISLAACDTSLDLQSPTFDLRKWLVAAMNDVGGMVIVNRTWGLYSSSSTCMDLVPHSVFKIPCRRSCVRHYACHRCFVRPGNNIVTTGSIVASNDMKTQLPVTK